MKRFYFIVLLGIFCFYLRGGDKYVAAGCFIGVFISCADDWIANTTKP